MCYVLVACYYFMHEMIVITHYVKCSLVVVGYSVVQRCHEKLLL
jgi:hypothetical protein